MKYRSFDLDQFYKSNQNHNFLVRKWILNINKKIIGIGALVIQF